MTTAALAAAAGLVSKDQPPRERILRVARELFYRHGLHSVGVETIAEAAGTNKMTLYRHFASKDLLIAECMRQIALDFEAEWTAIAAEYVGDARRTCDAWVRLCFDLSRGDHDRGCALANAAIQLPDPDHPAKRVIAENKAKFRVMTADLCRAAGYAEPELLADELYLLCEGAWASLESAGADGPAAHLPRIIENLLTRHAQE